MMSNAETQRFPEPGSSAGEGCQNRTAGIADDNREFEGPLDDSASSVDFVSKTSEITRDETTESETFAPNDTEDDDTTLLVSESNSGHAESWPDPEANQELLELMRSSERRILEAFEKKLAYDSFKEKQISKLHEEMQEYKRGLADSLMMPLIKQLIRYLDQIPRHIESLRQKPVEKLGPERLFKELDGVREDLESILENVGVTLFQEPCSTINRKRQLPRLTEETDRKEQHGAILSSLLPGYEFNGKLIEPERVKVSVYRETQENTPESTTENS